MKLSNNLYKVEFSKLLTNFSFLYHSSLTVLRKTFHLIALDQFFQYFQYDLNLIRFSCKFHSKEFVFYLKDFLNQVWFSNQLHRIEFFIFWKKNKSTFF